MTQEEKQLLLKDLCGRLPYGVKFTLSGGNIYTMKGIDLIVTDDGDWEYAVTAKDIEPIEIEYVKPYLRPISSMTEEEENELDKTDKESSRIFFKDLHSRVEKYGRDNLRGFLPDYPTLDWLLAHHFDYRGLIEKGLALEAPEGMYKTE